MAPGCYSPLTKVSASSTTPKKSTTKKPFALVVADMDEDKRVNRNKSEIDNETPLISKETPPNAKLDVECLSSAAIEINLDQIPLPSTPPPPLPESVDDDEEDNDNDEDENAEEEEEEQSDLDREHQKRFDNEVDSFEILEQTLMKQRRLSKLKNTDLRRKVLLKRTFDLVCEIMDAENGFNDDDDEDCLPSTQVTAAAAAAAAATLTAKQSDEKDVVSNSIELELHDHTKMDDEDEENDEDEKENEEQQQQQPSPKLVKIDDVIAAEPALSTSLSAARVPRQLKRRRRSSDDDDDEEETDDVDSDDRNTYFYEQMNEHMLNDQQLNYHRIMMSSPLDHESELNIYSHSLVSSDYKKNKTDASSSRSNHQRTIKRIRC